MKSLKSEKRRTGKGRLYLSFRDGQRFLLMLAVILAGGALSLFIISCDEDREAKALLDRLQIDRFGEGKDSMYDTVREMRRWIKEKREKSP